MRRTTRLFTICHVFEVVCTGFRARLHKAAVGRCGEQPELSKSEGETPGRGLPAERTHHRTDRINPQRGEVQRTTGHSSTPGDTAAEVFIVQKSAEQTGLLTVGFQDCSSVSKITNRRGWEVSNAKRALVSETVLLGKRDQTLAEATWQHGVVLAMSHYCRIAPFPQKKGNGTIPVGLAIEPLLKFFTR